MACAFCMASDEQRVRNDTGVLKKVAVQGCTKRKYATFPAQKNACLHRYTRLCCVAGAGVASECGAGGRYVGENPRHDGRFGTASGVSNDWVVRVIGSVGDYGEMFERNLGHQSALRLERGLNRLWTQGGLMYAPPWQ